jgi:uncharacterized protein (DUF427 family)/CBS domain-containing protein
VLVAVAAVNQLRARPPRPRVAQQPTATHQKAKTMTKEIRVPDEDHPITIDADTRRIVARVGDTVIADTMAALTLREAGYPPVHYIPIDDVAPGTLHPSSTQSYCPYKGDASYYDVVLPDGRQIVDAVWTYPTPHPAMAAIAKHVAFYTDRVQVTAEGPLAQMARERHPAEITEHVRSAAELAATLTVPDLMRAALVSVERDAHLAAAAYLMRRAGETALVVVKDTNQSTPLAIITDTDVARAIADGHDPNEVRLSDLVHRDPITVSPDTTLVRAATVSDACRALVEMQNGLGQAAAAAEPVGTAS